MLRDTSLSIAKNTTLLIAVPLFFSSQALAAGGVQGKALSDADGSPLSGAAVVIYRTSPGPTVSRRVTAAADGTFAAADLSVGRYGVCVQPPSGSFIDACGWPELTRSVQVSDGKTVSAGSIRLKSRTTLSIRVNDTAQALVKRSADQAPPHVLVGAMDFRGVFHPAREVKRNGAGIDYEVAIPPDTPVTLQLFSGQVRLETAQHQRVSAKGYNEVVVHSQKSPPAQHVFNVIGRL